MKVVVGSFALAGLADAASPKYKQFYSELSGCHLGFGSCINSLNGYHAAFDPVSCSKSLALNETDGSLVASQWFAFYESADAFEADKATNGTMQIARLADSESVKSFSARLPAGVSVSDWLFCKDGTYAFTSAPVPGTLSVAAPDVLKISPLLQALEASGQLPMQRVHLTPQFAGKAASVRAQWAVRGRSLASGSPRISLPNPVNPAAVNTLRVSGVAAGWLAAQPEVAFVEPFFVNTASNFDAAQSLQSGYKGTAEEARDEKQVSTRTTLWNHGVRGQGQIVGVGDSGLDTEPCFFRDDVLDESAETVKRVQGGGYKTSKDGKGIVYNYPNSRKVIQYVSYADGAAAETGSHGTHVAGSVAGSVNATWASLNATISTRLGPFQTPAEHHQGMAPAAKIAFFDIGYEDGTPGLDIPEKFEDFYGPSYSVGARIHTNSWGSSYSYYSSDSISNDAFVFAHQDFLPLFAAGNQGPLTNSIGSPSQAKNMVTVGARFSSSRAWNVYYRAFGRSAADRPCLQAEWAEKVNNVTVNPPQCGEYMADFSSNGPTMDGRLKPDVAAPGFWVLSCESQVNPTNGDVNDPANFQSSGPSCKLTLNAGTSMATPLVAGSTALVRQWFMDGYYPSGIATAANAFTPMGALLKAVLVNGADLMTGKSTSNTLSGPDVFQGFGSVHLDSTLLVAGNKPGARSVFVDGNFNKMPKLVATGDQVQYSFTMPADGLGSLKATLVWFEPAASGLAVRMIINDLDLVVTSPSGKVFGGADRLNTVEQVEVAPEKIEKGVYTVAVVARKINYNLAAQPFAVVISGSMTSTPVKTEVPALKTDAPTTAANTTAAPTTAAPKTDAPTTAAPTTAAPTTAAPKPDVPNNTGTAFIVVGIVGGLALSVGMIWGAIKMFKPEEQQETQVAAAAPASFASNPKFDAKQGPQYE